MRTQWLRTMRIVFLTIGLVSSVLMLIADRIGIGSGGGFGIKQELGVFVGGFMIVVGLLVPIESNSFMGRRMLKGGLGLFVLLSVVILRFGNPQWCRFCYMFQAYVWPKAMSGVNPPRQYTGTWVTWYSNGRRQYLDNYRDGNRHGTSLAWDRNGNKIADINFADDRLHGTCTYWDEYGNVIRIEKYEEGRLILSE